ncbi:MAG: hypothetical protein ACOX3W_08805 [Christensenellaceae bacterium]|jgi:hypothetical protein
MYTVKILEESFSEEPRVEELKKPDSIEEALVFLFKDVDLAV